MLVRIFLFLLIGLGVAGLGGAALVIMHKNPPPQVVAVKQAPPPVAPKVAVLAAAHDIRAGNLLVPADLTAKELPADALPAGASRDNTDTRAALLGAMVRRSLQAGQPIRSEDVLSPGDRGFLAAVLAPGMRAVTVGVDSVSGTAGLIWPGDRVDLILTETIDEQGQPLPQRVAGETVLQDLRVIAVDQTLVEGGQAASTLHPAEQNRTVTLEVTPENAERVAVAGRLGKLALAVRSAAGDPADRVADGKAAAGSSAIESNKEPGATHAEQAGTLTNDKPEPVQLLWGGDVSKALGLRPGKAGLGVRVFRGSQEAVEVKF